MTSGVGIETNRKCTDIYSLICCIILVAATLILVGYSAITGNLTRFDRVHDDCGNFCGEKNNDNPFHQCGPRDLQNFPKLLTISGQPERHECVEKCPEGYIEEFNNCLKFTETHKFDEKIQDADGGTWEIISKTWHSIALICFVAFCFSYICLVLFRHAAIYVIWIINIAFVIFAIFLALFFLYLNNPAGGAIMGFFALVLVGLLIWFRKRITLVAKLFKETSKALMDIPALMFEPILTLLSLIISFAIFVTLAIVTDFSRKLERHEVSKHSVIISYKENPVNNITFYLNLFTFIWFTQFIIGCQHFVIAGTITRWYFTRDKTKIISPIRNSLWHLMRFHLGSICFGSMLITIVKVMKALLTSAKQQSRESRNPLAYCVVACIEWLVELLDELLQYLVRNAYVIVAKEGTGFITSGKRAYGLLLRNIMDVIALNNFGDIVLAVCRLLIVLIAGFVGYAILNTRENEHLMAIPLTVGIILAFLIAHCFVTVFEMTVDTIFICFCIDIEENDGEQNPYFMSDGLRKIMMEMKGFSGGNIEFGRKYDMEGGHGMADGSCIPMLVQQPMQPPYPQVGPEGQAVNYYNPPPYPGQQVYQQQPYPQDPYPGQQMPYPGQQAPYPVQQGPYTSQQMPYADQQLPEHKDTWETEQSEKQQNYYYQQQPYPPTSYPPINYNQQ